jgi:dGTPase
MEFKSERYLTELFNAYKADPELLPESAQKNENGDSLERCICDYISGMTDRYAIGEYKKLFSPDEKD